MNGERVVPPLRLAKRLTITVNAREVQLATDFGLIVRFDGRSHGGKRRRNISSDLKRHLRGLFINVSISPFIPPLSLNVSKILMPKTYQKRVRGLCGNYDGKTENEYMTPSGYLVSDLNTFGERWRVSDREADQLKTIQLNYTVHR